MAIFHGTKHDDDLNGTSGNDTFELYKGGEDTAHGGAGDDVFNMGASLDAGDRLDGGADRDLVTIHGDYSAGLVFQGQTIQNIEVIRLGAGFDYNLTMADGNVAAGEKLSINASRLGAGNHLVFDGSAETDGHYVIAGGAGDDTITGGAKADIFHLEAGGNDTVHGGGGGDVFLMGGAFTAADQIDGGAGSDTLSLDGTYATPITVSGTMVQNVETVTLAGSGYNIAWQSAIASTLTVDASAIGSGNSVLFDSTSLATGNVHFIAGAGDTVFRGGGGDDTVDLQNSADGYNVSGGDGDDTVNFGAGFGAGLPVFDHADGNAGSNTATFDGDYSGGLTLGLQAFTVFSYGLTDFQTIKLLGDHSYTVTFDDSQVGGATLTGGAALTVDASALGAGDHADLDFSLSAAPSFTVTGSAGDDTVTFAANFAAGDAVNSGAGSDTLELKGDYSAGLTFGATTITNVETLKLDDGFSYKFTTNDGNVASGATLTVDASALTGTNALTFDGLAETNGFFAITGGAGDDSVTFGSKFSVSDSIDGGAGSDTVTLTNIHGIYNFTDTTIANVEDLVVTFQDNSSNDHITTTDANVAAGATMIVDFSNSGLAIGIDDLTFDGSAETDGHFHFIAPHESAFVTITGGALSDSLTIAQLDGPTNVFNGLGGDDTVTMASDAFGFLQFDGGTGNDTVTLTGGGTIAGHMGLISVENMVLDDNNWNVTLNSGAFTGTLNVDATALTAGHTLAFDGSQVAGGAYVFTFAGNFVTGDSLTGGAGNDTLSLNGDYTLLGAFGASTIRSVETITVADGHSYDLDTNDANVAAGATLTVDASALTGANQMFFAGGAETDGHFAFIGGAGDDDLTGGAQSDTFDLSRSDGAFVFGNGGNDSFTVTSAAKFLDDSIDGGAGSDTLILNGDFSTQTAITAGNVARIETLQLLGAGNSYNLVLDPGIAGAATLTVDGSAAASLTLDASGAPATAYTIIGSAGNDALTGGGQNDGFNLTGGGNDTVHGGAGNDTFSFGGAFTAADTVDGGANSDTISLNGDYSAALTLAATTLTSVENIVVQAGHSYDLITNDANVAAGATLNVSAGSLGAGDTLTFNGAAETDGSFAITGGAGNDVVTGGALADTFDLTKGGTDTVHGGGGNDTITLGSSFSAASTVDGGAGSDTVNLVNIHGDFTFTATTIQNVEDLAITGTERSDASFTTNDANVAAGATMIVDFSSSGPVFGVNSLTFDGSAETDGHFAFVEPAGSFTTTLTGGALSDTLSLTHGDSGSNFFNGLGGDDTVTTTGDASALVFDGGAGNDTLAFTGGGNEDVNYTFTSVENVTFDDNNWTVEQRFEGTPVSLNIDATALSGGHTLTFNGIDTFDIATDSFVFEFAGNFISGDSLIGGAGNDTLSLNGDYSGGYAFGAGQLTSIETILLAAGHDYTLTTNNANVASGATLTVDGSALGSSDQLVFNGAAETDGHFVILGGAGADHITGGNGGDTITGGGGADIFSYTSVSQSNTVNGYDTITDLASADSIHIAVGVPTFFAGETVSAYQGSLDADLASALSGMGAGKYAVVTLTGGTDPLDGHTFLVVDGNGTAGYTAGADYVIDITNFTGDPSLIHFI